MSTDLDQLDVDINQKLKRRTLLSQNNCSFICSLQFDRNCFLFCKVVKKLKDPPLPVEEEEEEEDDAYFKTPNQILELYTHLEEQNLFLIQNVQETEEGLEELKTKYSETRSRLDSETESLKSQISSLQFTIDIEWHKQQMLSEHSIQAVGGFSLGRGGGPSSTLEELNQKAIDQ